MRVIRVLEYRGDKKWLEYTFAHNGVKRIHGNLDGSYIKELILGTETPLLQRLRLAWKIVRGTYV
ncbi:MAG: hypothetical protein ACRD2L_23495 [Terriglobia bacterium]